MLILTENKAINFDQVFYFSVSVPVPISCSTGARVYELIAHHSGLDDSEGNSDDVVIKSYTSKAAAHDDLDRIIEAYQSGALSVDLR